jgi:hypothetical protein
MPGALGTQVITALTDLTRAARALAAGQGPGQGATHWAQVSAAARSAHAGAAAASSHPSILAHLSFPDSHKVGVGGVDHEGYIAWDGSRYAVARHSLDAVIELVSVRPIEHISRACSATTEIPTWFLCYLVNIGVAF